MSFGQAVCHGWILGGYSEKGPPQASTGGQKKTFFGVHRLLPAVPHRKHILFETRVEQVLLGVPGGAAVAQLFVVAEPLCAGAAVQRPGAPDLHLGRPSRIRFLGRGAQRGDGGDFETGLMEPGFDSCRHSGDLSKELHWGAWPLKYFEPSRAGAHGFCWNLVFLMFRLSFVSASGLIFLSLYLWEIQALI